MKNWLFKRIDNSSLIVFRLIFGLLITLEAWGAIATGWVKEVLVDPKFTFNFLGLDFLQLLQGPYMYAHFLIMGCFGVMVMTGFRYRVGIIGYTIFWMAAYFMQKSAYNNHYYLLILILVFMCLAPAHKYFSADAKRNPNIKSLSMPNWIRIFIIGQLWVVYTFASVAKFYPDWLDGTFPELLMSGKRNLIWVGDLLQTSFAHQSIIYVGILFDLLVIPLLLWKRTRMFIFIFSIFFHLFNSLVFQIGIFPYMSLAFTLFFFSAETINQNFLSQKPLYTKNEVKLPFVSKIQVVQVFLIVWFVIQIGLPLRHRFIPNDVLWTEEGHRLSWRMMLRSKHGITKYKVIDKKTGEQIRVKTEDYLTKRQHKVMSKPDCIWQLAQRIHEDFADQGIDVEVYANTKISVNQRPYYQLIDSDVDLATAKFHYFTPNPWVLPKPEKF
ncbi:HTTM domain-containing protein [Psychroflexus planctonicus]|uniref:Type I deoxyribonuclease HsdR n=1 Tax=Psychroflexus planctonicus TaxID=1526575 RepID=A0ABQ1SKL7_9FLAO|nr:HTTM domain-containing protein [Psychroflexus planctonicus]GGE41500.1 type I deoxyribonuclease HsdR [Psychroflexus planctonicus]